MKGTHTTHPAVKMRLASHVVVESPDPLIVECDGEMPYTEAHRLEISLLPKKLRVIV
jgi:diacylglycerol kinase family enzyme